MAIAAPSFDANAVLNGRGGRLPNCSYKLIPGGGQYGLDVAMPDRLDIDERAMSVVVPFADGNRRDGVGDLLEVGGIDTSRHRLNPIVLFDHGKHVQLPIALAEHPETKAYTVQIDPVAKSAQATAYFYRGGDYAHALFCEQLFDLIAKRYVRAGSIGYQVVHAKELYPDYETGVPKGLHLLQVLMLECSAVVLPANSDTVRKALALPRVCGKPLSPYLIKSLTPYAGENTKVVSGSDGKALDRGVGWETTERTWKVKPGDTVISRSYMNRWLDGGKQTPFSRTGDRLRVIRVEPSFYTPGFPPDYIVVENAQGDQHKVSASEVRAAKSLKSIRSRYRRKLLTKGRGEPCKRGETAARSGCVSRTGGKRPASGGGAIAKKPAPKPKAEKKPPAPKKEPKAKPAPKPTAEKPISPKPKPSRAMPRKAGLHHDDQQRHHIERHNEHSAQAAEHRRAEAEHGGRWSELSKRRIEILQELEDRGPGGGWGAAAQRRRETLKPELDKIHQEMDRHRAEREKRRKLAEESESSAAEHRGAYADYKKPRAPRKKKSLGILQWQVKSLSPLRSKYRKSAKGFRRRLKKSSPGASVLYVGPKDLDAARELAEQKGLKFTRIGPGDGETEKVKLLGDDAAIDEVARAYGRPIKAFGKNQKSLTGVKPMAKELKRRVKAAPEGMDTEPGLSGDDLLDVPAEDPAMDGAEDKGEMHSDEPYGAQILRRLHEDHRILMQDYDDMLGPLEHEGVKAKLESKLESLEAELTEIEELFSEHYSDLPELEGMADDKDMDEGDGLPADSEGEEEEPTPEEVVEGMESKAITGKAMSQTRLKYRAKARDSAGGGWNKNSERRAAIARMKEDEDVETDSIKSQRQKGKALCPKCGKEGCDCQGEKLAPLAAAAIPVVAGAISGALSPQEKGMIKEASGFLGELSQEGSQFGDDERMKSYHYHKTMEGIGQLDEAREDLNEGGESGDIPPAEFEPGAGAKNGKSAKTKAAPGSDAWAAEEMQEPEHQNGDAKSHRKMCKEASGFFRELSTEKAFGAGHRQKAGYWHRALDPLSKEGEEPEEAESADATFEPGEMDTKQLRENFRNQYDALDALSKRLESLSL